MCLDEINGNKGGFMKHEKRVTPRSKWASSYQVKPIPEHVK